MDLYKDCGMKTKQICFYFHFDNQQKQNKLFQSYKLGVSYFDEYLFLYVF